MMVSGKYVKRLLLIGAGILGLIIFSTRKIWIEDYYSDKLFRIISFIQRALFGWIPFSIGDILYLLLIITAVFFLTKNIFLILRKRITSGEVAGKFMRLITILLTAYLLFMVLWGLNYNRKGIAYQMEIEKNGYDSADLFRLHKITIQELNKSVLAFEESGRLYPDNKHFFDNSVDAYRDAKKMYPFLSYYFPSVKSSLYSRLFNYMGFSGYYNPFTGEAQVNTSVPKFTIPSITLHEMAHQLGYAKENEANFVSFLVGTSSMDPLFRYSSWFEFFLYINSQVRFYNPEKAQSAFSDLDTLVRKDIEELRQFNLEHRSFMESATYWIYGNYLKFNDQPHGMRSYNEVVSLVVAYYKKRGAF